MSRLRALGGPLALLAAVGLWQGLWLTGLPDFVLSPVEVARHFARAIASGELLPHVGASLARSLPGFALGTAVGVGLGLLAYVNIRLNKHSGSSHAPMSDFARDVQLWPEVVECYAMSGDMDYLMRIQVADLAHFSRFAMDTLMRHPAVIDMRSFFALQQIKETTELRL